MTLRLHLECDVPECGEALFLGDAIPEVVADDGNLFTVETGWEDIPEGWAIGSASFGEPSEVFCPAHRSNAE